VAGPQIPPPPLPASMTWDEYLALPAQLAARLELSDGRPLWIADEMIGSRESLAHQTFVSLLCAALRRSGPPDQDVGVVSHRRLFLRSDRSSFTTPDVAIVRRPGNRAERDLFAGETTLACEVLMPSDEYPRVVGRQQRYCNAGIPFYWEVDLDQTGWAIAEIRAYARQDGHGILANNATPRYPSSYLPIGEWRQGEKITIAHPFPIAIAWSELDDQIYPDA
jgi:Uma2 family endonuclease